MRIPVATLTKNQYFRPKAATKDSLIHQYSDITENYRLNEVVQKNRPVTDNLQGTHFHTNYLSYLEIAWANHFGVVVTPDIIWHTLLSELVLVVGKNPTEYASLFTDIPDKKQHIIIMAQGEVMPLDTLIESIKNLVPTDSDAFMPEFTTTTEKARFARYASFADLVSPYYNYSMMMCGIPYVDLQGTDADWQKVLDSWTNLEKLFPKEAEYFKTTKNVLKQIIEHKNDPTFWLDMFKLEKCGSGSQTEVEGWFSKLFRDTPSVRYVRNYSTHLAKVSYRNLSLKKDYEMYHGVLNSTLQDDCLVPDFGHMVFERLENPIFTKSEGPKYETIIYQNPVATA